MFGWSPLPKTIFVRAICREFQAIGSHLEKRAWLDCINSNRPHLLIIVRIVFSKILEIAWFLAKNDNVLMNTYFSEFSFVRSFSDTNCKDIF